MGIAIINSDVGVSKGDIRVGYVIKNRAGDVIVRVGQYVGKGTVNVGEYTALLFALRHAVRIGFREAICTTDSELMARQISGRYRVTSDEIKPLYEEFQQLAKMFDRIAVHHAPRSGNAEADSLAHQTVFEEPILPAPKRGGGRRPRALLSWQAALVRQFYDAKIDVGAISRAFGLDNPRLTGQIGERLTYAKDTLDGLPDWSNSKVAIFSKETV